MTDAERERQPNTITHDSIPAETGKNDEDRTSGDCISRQMAIDALCDYLVGKRCPDDGTLTCRLIENEVINKLPSAQPERKTGRWIPDNTDYYRTKFICSACGESEEVPTTGFGYGTMWDYCPMCGAKMKGGEQE